MNPAAAVALYALTAALVWGLPAAIVAGDRGRSAVVYFVFGILLGPLALIHALVQPRTFTAELARQEAAGRLRCWQCCEFVYQDAQVCAYCAADLTEQRVVDDLEAVKS